MVGEHLPAFALEAAGWRVIAAPGYEATAPFVIPGMIGPGGPLPATPPGCRLDAHSVWRAATGGVMPYRDPEARRACVRESVRRHRAGEGKPRGKPLPELAELRVETVKDVLAVLVGELGDVRRLMDRGTPERARVAGYLCGLLIRCFETADIEERSRPWRLLFRGREEVTSMRDSKPRLERLERAAGASECRRDAAAPWWCS